MEEALKHCGLPVKCRKCRRPGRVKPGDYNGWYKTRIFGHKPNKWFCPEHYDIANDMEDRYYNMSASTVPPADTEDPKEAIDELYELLD